MKPANFTFKIDIQQIANGMSLSVDEARAFLDDGRIVGRYAEFVVQNKQIGNRAKSEGSSYDNDAPDGKRIEVRSMDTRVSFSSSKEVGYGRKQTAQGWADKLNAVDIWCLVDYSNFEEWSFIFLTTDEVKHMADIGVMKKNHSISRRKLLKYLTKNNIL